VTCTFLGYGGEAVSLCSSLSASVERDRLEVLLVVFRQGREVGGFECCAPVKRGSFEVLTVKRGSGAGGRNAREGSPERSARDAGSLNQKRAVGLKEAAYRYREWKSRFSPSP
jgi:hypothetical protein